METIKIESVVGGVRLSPEMRVVQRSRQPDNSKQGKAKNQ
jgi:hypothetical protein